MTTADDKRLQDQMNAGGMSELRRLTNTDIVRLLGAVILDSEGRAIGFKHSVVESILQREVETCVAIHEGIREQAVREARAQGAAEVVERVESVLFQSDDGTEYEHNGHPETWGEDECPACWVMTIRAALTTGGEG